VLPGAPIADGLGDQPQNLNDPAGPQVGEDIPPQAPPALNAAAGQGDPAPGRIGVHERRVEQPPQNPNWWGFFKELQMIVVGFFTSLLPGFQHVE
jgi:hypothetical protein